MYKRGAAVIPQPSRYDTDSLPAGGAIDLDAECVAGPPNHHDDKVDSDRTGDGAGGGGQGGQVPVHRGGGDVRAGYAPCAGVPTLNPKPLLFFFITLEPRVE